MNILRADDFERHFYSLISSPLYLVFTLIFIDAKQFVGESVATDKGEVALLELRIGISRSEDEARMSRML